MMAIKDTYYLEVIIMQEVSEVYNAPPEADIIMAKKHGYILQSVKDSY